MSAARIYGTRSRIRPGVDLDTITVILKEDGSPPEVEMRGRIVSRNPKVRGASEVVIYTTYLSKAGREWVEEIKHAFDGETTA
jgi:hypothetical protein